MTKTILFNLSDAELEKFITDMGQPKFRAKQIREWLNRGVPDFAQMKNIHSLKNCDFAKNPKISEKI